MNTRMNEQTTRQQRTDLTSEQYELLQATRDAIAADPGTYDEPVDSLPWSETPGCLAAHLVAQREDLVELADSRRPELDDDAIRVAVSMGLGVNTLPPLLDAPWPPGWFRAASIELGHENYELPTAGQTGRRARRDPHRAPGRLAERPGLERGHRGPVGDYDRSWCPTAATA